MRRWLTVIGLGLLLGIATARFDVLGGGIRPDDSMRAIGMILNAGAVWAGLAVLSGWILGRPAAGAVAGFLGLAAAVAGYYASGALLGDRTQVGLVGLTGVIRLWAMMALVAGPVLGIAGALIHRHGAIGTLAALVVPVGVLVEVFGVRRLGAETFAVDPTLGWAQTAMVAVALGGAVAALLMFARTRGSRSGPSADATIGDHSWTR